MNSIYKHYVIFTAFEQLLETLNIGSAGDSTSDSSHDDHEGHDHKKRSVEEMLLTSQCLSESALAQIYSLDLADGITKEQFVELCPVLIQQQVSNSCVSVPEKVSTDPTVTNAEKYGYGTLAVIIISLLSLLGALLIPCLNAQIVQYILSMFIAMVQLPWSVMHYSTFFHSSKVTVSDTVLLQLVATVHVQPHSHSFDLDSTKGNSEEKGDNTKEKETVSEISDDDSTTRKTCHGVTALTIMILVGDIIHNLLDGVAMGVAFSQSLQSGLGTSIAIFVHELPHELGDFSIYLQSGVSKVRAVILNLIAACTA
ncbi:SLC39A12 [Bugula neritina]|uniref:SLC39A12 n=1 Tax=Bugula neritina TaxID=10212 RepID=A0A7J7JMK7_BUGNE|nr:SLC39A12 [Bugula neritina]